MAKNLPADCVFKILTFLPPLTPRDACEISTVSTVFRAAADSDSIWEKFLPPDYEYFISKSSNFPVETLKAMSKKKLYLHLCNNPIEIGDDHLMLSLDKPTGKKVLMVKAERFEHMYSRLLENIQLIWSASDIVSDELTQSHSTPYEVGYQANLESRVLSAQTIYVSYFLFKINHYNKAEKKPYDDTLLKLCLNFDGDGEGALVAVLQPQTDVGSALEDRHDGLKEIVLGEFYSGSGDAGSILCIVEDYLCMYGDIPGIAFEGIELRPKP